MPASPGASASTALEYRLVEDRDFFLRLQHLGGPIERIRQPLYRYRDHEGSLSHREGSKRYITSLKMHYDLITRGIEKNADLQFLFFDHLSKAALYHDHKQMTEILDFARREHLSFVSPLELHDQRLRSPLGWLLNRLSVGAVSRYERLQGRLARGAKGR